MAFESLRSSAELKALRVFAELAGGFTLLVGLVRWVRSGSLVVAVSPFLPVIGWLTLAAFFLVGVGCAVFLRGSERLAGLFAVPPVLFVLAGLDVSRLGLLVLGYWVVLAASAFVDLFRSDSAAPRKALGRGPDGNEPNPTSGAGP